MIYRERISTINDIKQLKSAFYGYIEPYVRRRARGGNGAKLTQIKNER